MSRGLNLGTTTETAPRVPVRHRILTRLIAVLVGVGRAGERREQIGAGAADAGDRGRVVAQAVVVVVGIDAIGEAVAIGVAVGDAASEETRRDLGEVRRAAVAGVLLIVEVAVGRGGIVARAAQATAAGAGLALAVVSADGAERQGDAQGPGVAEARSPGGATEQATERLAIASTATARIEAARPGAMRRSVVDRLMPDLASGPVVKCWSRSVTAR